VKIDIKDEEIHLWEDVNEKKDVLKYKKRKHDVIKYGCDQCGFSALTRKENMV